MATKHSPIKAGDFIRPCFNVHQNTPARVADLAWKVTSVSQPQPGWVVVIASLIIDGKFMGEGAFDSWVRVYPSTRQI